MKPGACGWRQFEVLEENEGWRMFMDGGSLTLGPGLMEALGSLGSRPSTSWFG